MDNIIFKYLNSNQSVIIEYHKKYKYIEDIWHPTGFIIDLDSDLVIYNYRQTQHENILYNGFNKVVGVIPRNYKV